MLLFTSLPLTYFYSTKVRMCIFGACGAVVDSIKCAILTPVIVLASAVAILFFSYFIKAGIVTRNVGDTFWSVFGHIEFYKWDEDFMWALYIVIFGCVVIGVAFLAFKYITHKYKESVKKEKVKNALMEVMGTDRPKKSTRGSDEDGDEYITIEDYEI